MTDTLTIPHVALHKAVPAKNYKKLTPLLPEGVSVVDFTTHITGTVKRGAPFEKKVAAKANPWKLLAKALSKLNGPTVDAIVRESIGVTDEEAGAVKLVAEQAIKKIIEATKTEMPGNVTANLIVELL